MAIGAAVHCISRFMAEGEAHWLCCAIAFAPLTVPEGAGRRDSVGERLATATKGEPAAQARVH